jgi:chromosome segregation ATPase
MKHNNKHKKMNLENQNMFDDLENILNSTLEFLKGKDSIIKEKEAELDQLENEIDFDLSKELNVDKKKLKLKDLEKELYEYEMRPSDILIECTHINNINNCIAKINGARVQTYGEAKLHYKKDIGNKEKLTTIINNMESELSKIKEENDIKNELRTKIVNSEMHLNSLNARTKLYEDTFNAFVAKEKDFTDEINSYNNGFNLLLSDIEKNNTDLEAITKELSDLTSHVEQKEKNVLDISDKITELEKKSEELTPAINNDISKLLDEKARLEKELIDLADTVKVLISDKKSVEKILIEKNKTLNNKENKEPLINSNINFLNTQYGSLEAFDNINDLWKSKFTGLKDNIDNLAKENKYKYSNANGDNISPVNPLIEYTERLQNMISFIKENDIVIDDNDIEEVETEIIYREKPKESKLNPIVIGAIAIGGALILSKTNN